MRDEAKTREQLVSELVDLRESLRRSSTNLRECRQDLEDVARYVISEFKSPLGMIVGFAELLEEEHATLSEQELSYCIGAIKQNGRKLSEMVSALLLLANSRRLSDNVWYTAYLAAMGETLLSKWALEQDTAEAYRFTCLPASSTPLVVRVWRSEGEEAADFHGVAKLGGGLAGSSENEAVSNSQEAEWRLAAEEWDDLLVAIEESRFWDESSSLEQLGWLRMVGAGGEEWVFEGWRDGQYKVRTVWNPDEDKTHAAHALGSSFVKFLPTWFTLEMAQLWTVDSRLKIHPSLGDEINLDFLL